jgi:hypothetical protein
MIDRAAARAEIAEEVATFLKKLYLEEVDEEVRTKKLDQELKRLSVVKGIKIDHILYKMPDDKQAGEFEVEVRFADEVTRRRLSRY